MSACIFEVCTNDGKVSYIQVWDVYVQGGKRELVLGVDDELLKEESRSIPRADVAELTVQCLTLAEANNR